METGDEHRMYEVTMNAQGPWFFFFIQADFVVKLDLVQGPEALYWTLWV